MKIVRHCCKCNGVNRKDIDGLVCNNCGHRVWFDIKPVLDYKPRPEKKPTYDPRVKIAAHHIVLKFYDSIISWRKRGMDWPALSKLLSAIGFRCHENNLQKYFMLEQEHREHHAKAQTAQA